MFDVRIIEIQERAICRRMRLAYDRVDRVWLREKAVKELRAMSEVQP